MIPLREVVIRFLLACIALNMKVTLYPLAKFWGYRRFEPQPDTVLVTCAAMCKPTTLSLRPAGSPEAALSARQCPGLRGASASLGRSAGWAASPLTGLRLGFRHRCCTNGLGHIHQMERVLGVLQEEGMKFPVIALAREQKVPAYKLAALKARFPETTFVNLNFEVNHSTVLAMAGVPAAASTLPCLYLNLPGGLRQRQVLPQH